jgi:hypothetical protein
MTCPLRARYHGKRRGVTGTRGRSYQECDSATSARMGTYTSSQADSEGSIPFTRSKTFAGQRHDRRSMPSTDVSVRGYLLGDFLGILFRGS